MFQEEKIKVGKYIINYLKVGHGAHIVLCLPGGLGTIWTDFKPQIEGFDREKFCLIIWDAPGYGKSRPPEREFHTNYYEQDVDTALEFMKALNIKKFSIMGWCYGGVTSIFLAVKYPEAVHKLIVWGARTRLEQNELDFYEKMKDINSWSEKMRTPKLEVYGETRFSELCVQLLTAVKAVYQATGGNILRSELLQKVNCPTLLLHGEKDPIINLSNFHSLHRSIQGCRIHLYPEGKHNIHLRYAEDFNKTVQDFLLHG